MTPRAIGLDASVTEVHDSLISAGVPAPDVLLFPATGLGSLAHGPNGLAQGGAVSVELGGLGSTPAAYSAATLIAGTIGTTSVWLVEDAPRALGTPGEGEDHEGGGVTTAGATADAEPAWAAAFPVWLAAQAGAKIMVHLSAGTALRATPTGAIARLTDHINLSGTTPLLGLGESRLGPLFPDQTRLHDHEVGLLAQACAGRLGVELEPAIAACTLGPALSTPAELRSYAAAGADIAVQRLSDPLVAAAHAGLVAVALTALTDTVGEELDIALLVERAASTAPRLEALALAITAELGPIAQRRREESEA